MTHSRSLLTYEVYSAEHYDTQNTVCHSTQREPGVHMRDKRDLPCVKRDLLCVIVLSEHLVCACQRDLPCVKETYVCLVAQDAARIS